MIFIITLTILFITELLIVSMVAAVYYYRKSHAQTQRANVAQNSLDDIQEEFESNILTINNFSKQFNRIVQQQLNISPYTRNKEDNLLHKRYQFIEAEINSLLEKEQGEEYWNNLCERLANLLPTHLFPTDGLEYADVETELDINTPIPELDAGNSDIPTLDSQVALNPMVKNTMAYVTLNPLQNEIKRFKRIIGRHFGLIGEIKNATAKLSNADQHNIPKLVKELQITHVQFSRSLKSLTTENARLVKLLTSSSTVTGNSSRVLDINKQRAIKPLKEPAKPKKRNRTQGHT